MSRRYLGLPANWLDIMAWMSACLPAAVAKEERIGLLKKKYPEIPKLSSYASAPEPGFWKNFPFFSPPAKPQGKIDTAVLENLISSCWLSWGVRERKIVRKARKSLWTRNYQHCSGVQYDTESQTWSLSPEKVASVVGVIDEVLLSAVVNLKTVQRLHGKLNDFSQMFNFSKGFQFLLASFQNDNSSRRLVKKELKRDLFIWKNFVLAAKSGLPLAGVPCGPPIRTLNFMSDAAGAEMVWINGKSVNASVPGDRGVASVGFDGKTVKFCGGTKWPTELLTRQKDRNGKFLGCKSTLLESIGLLIPFVTIPNKLRGKFVRLFVDNTNVVYGWEKRMCKSDAKPEYKFGRPAVIGLNFAPNYKTRSSFLK